MDTAVDLVSAYLQLNGYFVQTEIPVVKRVEEDPPRFEQLTDIDVLAVRFPSAVHPPAPIESDHWAGVVAVDTALNAPEDEMDVIIGEVKEGRSRLNPNLVSGAVLEAALRHAGGCMPADVGSTVEQLLQCGEARALHCHGGVQRIRLVAFGGTRPDEPKRKYRVIPLADVIAFVQRTIDANRAVFSAITPHDPALGMIMLMAKLRGSGAGS